MLSEPEEDTWVPSILPLADVKVVEIGWAISGPLATTYLAENGATIIKLESMKKIDGTRLHFPNAGGIPGINRCISFAQNRHIS